MYNPKTDEFKSNWENYTTGHMVCTLYQILLTVVTEYEALQTANIELKILRLNKNTLCPF
jgi:hypothetical protein